MHDLPDSKHDPSDSKLNLAGSSKVRGIQDKISEIQCATRKNAIAFCRIQEEIWRISDAI
jgi:hypothetical protein